jgi:acyl carrier protein phosphodiesterase
VFRRTKSRLSPRYRIYSGIIADLYYDHYLARNWEEYSDEKLRDYVARAYFLLIRKFHLLPQRSRRILPFMVTQNWLAGYADFDSLQKVFNGMTRRTEHKSGMENAITDLKQDYRHYEADFREFFPDLITHSEQFLRNLLQTHSSDRDRTDQ